MSILTTYRDEHRDDDVCHAALRLAAEGFHVFPQAHGTKVPLKHTRGLLDATTNPATIKRLFGGHYPRNLAVRTGAVSRCFVLNVDDHEAIEALQSRHGTLPVTRASRSSRGYHYWFKHPGTPIPNSQSRLGPGIDVRGDDGCVTVPPSLHPDGVLYGGPRQGPRSDRGRPCRLHRR